ncbi:MAG: hypothetical protein QW343_01490 [Candidatus Norongarragalinales archaeon]
MFSIDLVVSLAIFLVVVLSASYFLSRMRANVDAANEKNILANSAAAAFDSLAYSPGYPFDWTPESVLSVGLASDYVELGGATQTRIDAAKLLQFAKLNYSEARSLLGLGAFDFQLSFHEVWNASGQGQGAALAAPASHAGIALEPIAYFAANDLDGFTLLSGRNVSWDFYWAGSGSEPPHGDARAFYSAAQYGGKTQLFNALLANATRAGERAYQTIVVESPNFTTLEYSSVNASALRVFLRERGLLVFEGSVSAADSPSTPLFLDSLNESLLFGKQSLGIINKTSFLIDNASEGDTASFADSNWAVYSNASRGDAPLFIFIQNASGGSESLALAARWNCENGRVYYVADFAATFGVNATPGSQVYNLVGPQLNFGVDYNASAAASSRDSFVVQRLLIIQRDWGSLAATRLVVWRS